jgi:hypothetical protein
VIATVKFSQDVLILNRFRLVKDENTKWLVIPRTPAYILNNNIWMSVYNTQKNFKTLIFYDELESSSEEFLIRIKDDIRLAIKDRVIVCNAALQLDSE